MLRRTLTRFVCLTFIFGAFWADASECDDYFFPKSRLASWDALPHVYDAELPAAFVRRLRERAVIHDAQRRFGVGEGFCFNLESLRSGIDGWGIQGRFLARVLTAMFPEAKPCGRSRPGRVMYRPTLYDSGMQQKSKPGGIDMAGLKAVNPGPDLPATGAARIALGLPADARILSIYSSWTHAAFAATVIPAIFRDDSADVVVWSNQNDGWPRLDRPSHPNDGGMRTLTSDEWASRIDLPSKNVLILNVTRGRLPYLHAAADRVVVLGMANAFEAVAAGKPTYVTAMAADGFDQVRRDQSIADLRRGGGLRVVSDESELRRVLKDDPHPPPHRPLPTDDSLIDRLVLQIVVGMVARVESRGR